MDTDNLIQSASRQSEKQEKARNFYRSFKKPGRQKRYLFGFNRYARSLMDHFQVDGIIDDYTDKPEIASVPVIKTAQIPAGALVLSVVGGRPLSARKKLSDLNIDFLDYFAFRKAAPEPLCPIHFNEGFEKDFRTNRHKYEWIYSLLADQESRDCFLKLVNFRLQYDLDFLEGFRQREEHQYFEPFLELSSHGECFADVGAFDGQTSVTFTSHCPDYKAIHLFEPDPHNLSEAQNSLSDFPRIHYHEIGLSDRAGSMKLSPAGSASRLCDSGQLDIQMARLDDIDCDDFSFIKMDIEGAELAAIEGARNTVLRCHPKLAIAIYHCSENTGPFWSIPDKILSIRNDYTIFVRHYTESIYETVMFFVPTADSTIY